MERAWRGERKLSSDMEKSTEIGPTRKALGCKRAARRERLLQMGPRPVGTILRARVVLLTKQDLCANLGSFTS